MSVTASERLYCLKEPRRVDKPLGEVSDEVGAFRCVLHAEED